MHTTKINPKIKRQVIFWCSPAQLLLLMMEVVRLEDLTIKEAVVLQDVKPQAKEDILHLARIQYLK
jgi:hypothetical protein